MNKICIIVSSVSKNTFLRTVLANYVFINYIVLRYTWKEGHMVRSISLYRLYNNNSGLNQLGFPREVIINYYYQLCIKSFFLNKM